MNTDRTARNASAAPPAKGSGATAGGREAAARGAVGRCPGSGPGRDGAPGVLPLSFVSVVTGLKVGRRSPGVSPGKAHPGYLVRHDHRSFSVARPMTARISETIQKRMTICGSAQPSFSKWWWIGAIRNTRFLVRL